MAYVPGTQRRQPAGRLRSELRHLDPVADNWQSERHAEAVGRQFDALVQLMQKSDGTPQDYGAVAGGSFWCSALRPSCDEIFRDAALTVRRGEPPRPWEVSREFKGPAGLAEAVKELLEPLAGAGDLRIEFKIDAIELADGRAVTEAQFLATGRTDQGQLQQTADWKCTWTIAEGSPLLFSIDVSNYHEALAHAPGGTLFSDVTEAVLGKTKAWSEQFAWSVDHFRARAQRDLAPELAGMTGLAVGDVNGDGLDDLYVCAGNGLPNRLLVQQPDGTVRDISAEAGVDFLDSSTSALLVDLDNDGDQDLIVATERAVLFLENDGEAKFTLRAAVEMAGRPMSMAAADYDGDGRLDVYICCHSPAAGESGMAIPLPIHDANNGAANVLLRNMGDWKFEDTTKAAGLDENNRRFSYACAWEDFDNDGLPDLYVANEFGRNNLFRNDGGVFRDIAPLKQAEDMACGTSVSWSDYNGNGRMDIYVGNAASAAGRRVAAQNRFRRRGDTAVDALRRLARGNTLLENLGQQGFAESGTAAGARRGDWSWSSIFCDINNDGRDDLVAANGFVSQDRAGDLSSFFWRRVAAQSPASAAEGGDADAYRRAWQAARRLLGEGHSWGGHERNACFLNLGKEFADVSAAAGLDFLDDARAVAVTDWNHNGALDLWISNRGAPGVRLLSNNAGGRSIALALQGVACNRDAIGARLELQLSPSGRTLIRTLRAGEGFLSQSSKWVHFGLGEADEAERLRVRWPGGGVDEYENLQAGGRYRLMQGESAAEVVSARPKVALKTAPPQLPRSSAGGRAVLPSRPPLPAFECKGLDGEWTSVGGKGETATLLMFWASWHPPSVQQLKEWTDRAFDLRLAALNVVALSVDAARPGEDVPAAAVEVAQRLKVPHTMALASPTIVNRIDAMQRALLSSERPVPLPCSLLLNADGNVCAIYRGPVSLKQILEDAKHLDDVKQLQARAVPLAGRWHTPPEPVNPFAVAEKLREYGHNNDAIIYTQRLIEIGHNQEPGYEQLLPDQLYYFLGTLQEEKGQRADAQRAYEMVVKIEPAHPEAHRRLAKLKTSDKLYDQAAEHWRVVVEARPGDDDARYEWAKRLADSGRGGEAIRQYRQLHAAKPSWPGPARELAWLLATHPDENLRDADEAVRIARGLSEASRHADPLMLDTLAAAYALAGRFDGAVTTGRQALEIAKRQNLPASQVQAIERRLQSYQAGQPFFADPKK